MDFDNDILLSSEEDKNINADISIWTDDEEKKEVPKEEPEKKVEDTSANGTEKKETEEPSKVDEKKTEDDEDDLDLSDLFADIEDANTAVDDSKKILDNIDQNGWISKEQVTELQAQLSTLKEINDKQSKQIKKLMNDSVDISYKNAELEAFGWVWTNPNILILSKNLDKAKTGDDMAKSKVVSVLKSLYEEFTGSDMEKENLDKKTDILAATSLYNSASNPNIKLNKDSDIEWLSM